MFGNIRVRSRAGERNHTVSVVSICQEQRTVTKVRVCKRGDCETVWEGGKRAVVSRNFFLPSLPLHFPWERCGEESGGRGQGASRDGDRKPTTNPDGTMLLMGSKGHRQGRLRASSSALGEGTSLKLCERPRDTEGTPQR